MTAGVGGAVTLPGIPVVRAADALGAVGVPDAATAHFGDARLEASARLLALSADGPTFAVWQLDAVAAPAW